MKNMVAMESDQVESGYVIASSPPPSLQHTGGQASEHLSNSVEPQSGGDAIQNGDITSFTNYQSSRHITP